MIYINNSRQLNDNNMTQFILLSSFKKFLVGNYEPIMGILGKLFNNCTIHFSTMWITICKCCDVNFLVYAVCTRSNIACASAFKMSSQERRIAHASIQLKSDNSGYCHPLRHEALARLRHFTCSANSSVTIQMSFVPQVVYAFFNEIKWFFAVITISCSSAYNLTWIPGRYLVAIITGQQIFGLVFFYFDFLVFLDVFWCAETENDISFFVVSAVFL